VLTASGAAANAAADERRVRDRHRPPRAFAGPGTDRPRSGETARRASSPRRHAVCQPARGPSAGGGGNLALLACHGDAETLLGVDGVAVVVVAQVYPDPVDLGR